MSQHPTPFRRFRPIPRALALAALLGLPALGQGKSAEKPDARARVDPLIEQLVEGHNKERAREGLPPLKLEAKLTEAALAHAKDMAKRKKMGHEGSDESTPEQRVVRAGYHYLRTGENVAVGYRDVEEVMEGWMDSPGHRHNILSDFSEIGLARVVGEDRKPYWAASFGTPMPKLEAVDASKDLFDRINEARAAAKLPKLILDEKLVKFAQAQATSLAKAKGGAASFDGLDAKAFSDLAMSVASGQPDPRTMAGILMEKPNLKEQILGKYARIGTGYATAEDGVPHWCLILGNLAKKK